MTLVPFGSERGRAVKPQSIQSRGAGFGTVGYRPCVSGRRPMNRGGNSVRIPFAAQHFRKRLRALFLEVDGTAIVGEAGSE